MFISAHFISQIKILATPNFTMILSYAQNEEDNWILVNNDTSHQINAALRYDNMQHTQHCRAITDICKKYKNGIR